MKHLLTLCAVFLLAACGPSGNSSSENSKGSVLTQEEELTVADSISREIKESTQTLKQETQEAKESIDQLLQDI